MSKLETYRLVEQVKSLAREFSDLSIKKEQLKKDQLKRKAEKDFGYFLKDVIKQIKKKASKGKFGITYMGARFEWFHSWNKTVEKLLLNKLLSLGFLVQEADNSYPTLIINWK